MANKEIDFPLQIKEISEDGTFSGYGAVFGNVDSDRDIILPGAFRKTLLAKSPVKIKMLWQHDRKSPIGVWESLVEDAKGLKVTGRLLVNQNIPKADEAYSLLRAKQVDGLSVGFSIPSGGSRYNAEKRANEIGEIDLWEISPVTFGSNNLALIDNVKTVTPFQDLPLADQGRTWDSDSARARIQQWAGGAASPEDMDWADYRKAFLWYSSDEPTSLVSYKLPIADVIDGELRAIPRAIFAAAAVMLGARGGVDIPANDRAKVASHLERYYSKLDRESPFLPNDEGGFKSNAWAAFAVCETKRDFEKALREAGFSKKEALGTVKAISSRWDAGEDSETLAALRLLNEELKSCAPKGS